MNVNIQPQTAQISIDAGTMGISVGNPITRELVERDPYTGDYTITPSAEAQILETRNLRMTDNLTIEPIPNNYGLITWNGSVITVS